MKKILLMILAAAMLLLCACAVNDTSNGGQSSASVQPSAEPSEAPSQEIEPSDKTPEEPSEAPSQEVEPTVEPSDAPTEAPTEEPTVEPSDEPTDEPTDEPSDEEITSGIMSVFSATDIYGDKLDDSVFEDYELTMVNVWATFCGPCLNEMPDLGELSDEYADKGVQIVGMVTDVLNSDGSISASQLDTAREIAEQTGADYPHIVPSEDLYGLLYQITSVPTTFFVDEHGVQVGSAYIGSREKDDWSAIIDEMLAEVEK